MWWMTAVRRDPATWWSRNAPTYRLRVLYRNFYDEIDDYEFEKDILKTMKESLNRIINTLSKLICVVCGSKKCQKL